MCNQRLMRNKKEVLIKCALRFNQHFPKCPLAILPEYRRFEAPTKVPSLQHGGDSAS